MKIASISFREGRLVESKYTGSMEISDMRKTLAYAFLYNLYINVYTESRKYEGFVINSIKTNVKGNLFFSGEYMENGLSAKKNFSWREIKYLEIEIDREPVHLSF